MDKSKLKVLLVDDEPGFLEVMGNRITSWGYTLLTATNGKDGIKSIKEHKPDIVVLDYMMPEMNGVETLKAIRKIDKDLPVIMFTAYPDKESIGSTKKLGAHSYVPKLSAHSGAHEALKAAINMAKKKIKE